MLEKEARIKSITRLYYSNPIIQKVLLEFAKNRETVPSYMMESFGKRPDTLTYPQDIISLVNRGATSFHASEEIWQDPLQISSDLSISDMNFMRKAWDLLIDIDSPYLDYSKIAAKLIIEALEDYGIKRYGLKFSGGKGFHIIVPSKSFPEDLNGQKTKDMFPEWPRAISEFLMAKIKPKYNQEITKLNINFKALEERTNLSKEELTEIPCPNCGEKSTKAKIGIFKCTRCTNKIERPMVKITKRKLKCIDQTCPGHFELKEEKEYYSCSNCGYSSYDKRSSSDKKIVYTSEIKKAKFSDEFKEEISAAKLASLDLVLVSPRHLFRMPYSLHERTSLASVVITKDQLSSFSPKDANPLKVKILNFYPDTKEEARKLLESAISWKKSKTSEEEQIISKKYEYKETDFSNVTEEIFPRPIKKLLNGLKDGKKRGLFILLTFYRSLNFSPGYINEKIREWNKKNDPPLKEGYIKSQIDWHLKQKKKILPPNYANNNFYKDLNLLDNQPTFKNPISEVARKINKPYS